MVEIIKTESRMVASRGWEGRMGSLCLLGTEFQFEKIKKFWRRMVMVA